MDTIKSLNIFQGQRFIHLYHIYSLLREIYFNTYFRRSRLVFPCFFAPHILRKIPFKCVYLESAPSSGIGSKFFIYLYEPPRNELSVYIFVRSIANAKFTLFSSQFFCLGANPSPFPPCQSPPPPSNPRNPCQ